MAEHSCEPPRDVRGKVDAPAPGDPPVVVDIVEPELLVPRAIFGINGKVDHGMHLHPDKKHMVFPLGNKIGIANTLTNRQEFIGGHTNMISCLDVSPNGQYLASGQINHMGFRAYVIIWDYEGRKELARHDLHKVRVQSVCFTAEEKYVVSIGGRDDGTVIVFDMETFTPICRSVAARSVSGNPLIVRGLRSVPSHFIVAGDRHLRLWSVQRDQKKLHVHDVFVGKQQRRFTSIYINRCDEFAYLGTMTGDIMKIVLNCCDLTNVVMKNSYAAMTGACGVLNPRKPYGKDCDRYVNGVRAVMVVDKGLLLIGAGDGTVELVEERKDVTEASFKDYPSPTWPMLRRLKHGKVNGVVSSLVKINPISYYIVTGNNEIYSLNIKTFQMKLLKTCHQKAVHTIIFPRTLSTVFATAGHETIRIWSTKRMQELLRIIVYNFICASAVFTYDGTSIISAWNDGVLRSFTPNTGRLIYAVPNAHNKGCSALCVSANGRMLVTGGIEGQVRVWKIEQFRQSLLGVLKDHSGPISTLDFNHNDTEVVSASSDGSCVIWDIVRLARKQVITANTQFMCASYCPTGVQLLTCGSDGRISYWMVYNGSLLRELEGSKKSSVNCIAINRTGDYFASVGSDQMVKIWDYNSGYVVCLGTHHASSVVSAAFSPCGQLLVTGSIDGSVIIWDVPAEFWGKPQPPVIMPSRQKLVEVEPKVSSVRSSGSKKENISELVAKTPKDNICCVECPAINMKKMPDVNENCDIVLDNRKC